MAKQNCCKFKTQFRNDILDCFCYNKKGKQPTKYNPTHTLFNVWEKKEKKKDTKGNFVLLSLG